MGRLVVHLIGVSPFDFFTITCSDSASDRPAILGVRRQKNNCSHCNPFDCIYPVIGFPSGITRQSWYVAEKIGMAPAQG